MFWQLASMSGFLSFGSCAIGILRNLFAATLPRLPKHPQSYSSCQFLAAKLGRNLWGSSLSSCYQPESIHFPITSDEAHCDCHPAGGRQRSRAHQGVKKWVWKIQEETAIHTLY